MTSKAMIHTRGIVTGIDKNGDAMVIMNRKNACGDGGCGSATTNNCKSCLSGAKIQARALNPHHAEKGDIVAVSFSTSKILKGAAALYLIPVAGVLTGAFAGAGLHKILSLSETSASLIAGFIGLALGFYIVRLISAHMSTDEGMTPAISKIISSKSDKQSGAGTTMGNSKIQTCTECH